MWVGPGPRVWTHGFHPTVHGAVTMLKLSRSGFDLSLDGRLPLMDLLFAAVRSAGEENAGYRCNKVGGS